MLYSSATLLVAPQMPLMVLGIADQLATAIHSTRSNIKGCANSKTRSIVLQHQCRANQDRMTPATVPQLEVEGLAKQLHLTSDCQPVHEGQQLPAGGLCHLGHCCRAAGLTWSSHQAILHHMGMQPCRAGQHMNGVKDSCMTDLGT